MTDGRRPAAVLLLVGLAAAAPTPVVAQAVQRVVYVSALDRAGRPVAELGAPDIVVREDNLIREILGIAPADEPMQIALLVDDSEAAESYIRDYRQAVPAFIEALTGAAEPGTRNEIALITLAGRPTISVDYTFDRARLLEGARRIFASSGSGTYLLDGVFEVSQGLTKRSAGRPVIVAITTEGPELSNRMFQRVLEALHASGAAFHVIVLGRPVNQSHDRAVFLGKGTRDSGGSYENVFIGTALTGRLRRLADQLAHQYRVTYARPRTLIPPERVTVTAARPGLVVRGTARRDERGEQP